MAKLLCFFFIHMNKSPSLHEKGTGFTSFLVNFGMPSKKIPPLIVYSKVLLHRFSFNGLLKAKVQTYFQTAKLFVL